MQSNIPIQLIKQIKQINGTGVFIDLISINRLREPLSPNSRFFTAKQLLIDYEFRFVKSQVSYCRLSGKQLLLRFSLVIHLLHVLTPVNKSMKGMMDGITEYLISFKAKKNLVC